MTILVINNINVVVCVIVAVLAVLAIIHLIKVYKKSPCGDCASAKQCNAFDYNKLKKAYKKACKKERRLTS